MDEEMNKLSTQVDYPIPELTIRGKFEKKNTVYHDVERN